jgi:putative ubiquitin-RnfH superfamily antitoxin RatB of RatAB toxin-antitoxin module
MKVGVVYANARHQLWLNVDVDDGANIIGAIQKSGILNYCPEIDLNVQKIGVYGKFAKLEALVHDGDRIEIYQRITRSLDDNEDD